MCIAPSLCAVCAALCAVLSNLNCGVVRCVALLKKGGSMKILHVKRLFMRERRRFRKKGQCILEQRSQRHGRTYSERHAALVLSGTQTSTATRGCKAARLVIHTVTDARIMSTDTYAEIPRLATKRDQPISLTACNGRNGRHTSTTPMFLTRSRSQSFGFQSSQISYRTQISCARSYPRNLVES